MSPEIFLDNRVILWPVDCKVGLAYVNANSIDSVVTDPPYALVSINDRFGRSNMETPSGKQPPNRGAQYKRLSKGFMGKQWDTGETAFDPEFWRQVLRVLKPGGHVVSFGGTRSYHRLACAIEDAGFEIRDCLQWLYGSGFPKSHDVSKGIDRAAGVERTEGEREWNGGGRSGGISHGGEQSGTSTRTIYDTPSTAAATEWQGWGTALKPACEPICLARKPLIGTVAENVLQHGTGAVNIDGCRIAGEQWTSSGELTGGVSLGRYGDGLNNSGRSESHNLGRWPANVLHDGSAEVVRAFPEADSAGRYRDPTGECEPRAGSGSNVFVGRDAANKYGRQRTMAYSGETGSAARFFYTAKADADDRLGFTHPTIKPVDLMQWLVRLVTPKGGMVLDPFAGTGTTGEAAYREGMRAMLIEREPEYQGFIRERMRLVMSGPDERARETVKRKPEPPKEGLLALMEGK